MTQSAEDTQRQRKRKQRETCEKGRRLISMCSACLFYMNTLYRIAYALRNSIKRPAADTRVALHNLVLHRALDALTCRRRTTLALALRFSTLAVSLSGDPLCLFLSFSF